MNIYKGESRSDRWTHWRMDEWTARKVLCMRERKTPRHQEVDQTCRRRFVVIIESFLFSIVVSNWERSREARMGKSTPGRICEEQSTVLCVSASLLLLNLHRCIHSLTHGYRNRDGDEKWIKLHANTGKCEDSIPVRNQRHRLKCLWWRCKWESFSFDAIYSTNNQNIRRCAQAVD